MNTARLAILGVLGLEAGHGHVAVVLPHELHEGPVDAQQREHLEAPGLLQIQIQIQIQIESLHTRLYTHAGLEGQPPVHCGHEVVTGDGEVDTLLQATR